MNKLTGEEILDKLNELESYDILSPDEFYNEGLNAIGKQWYGGSSIEGWEEDDQKRINQILSQLGTVVCVTTDSPDAEWDYYSRAVHHFVDHDVYIETRGHYTSYVGTEYDDGFGEVVRPVEKMFTVYEKVK